MSTNMKFTKPRATIPELLEFCNKVREAGGGNPLDALMPAVPSDVTQCLIAKNLNFNCGVSRTDWRGKDRWAMVVADQETRNKIAKKVGLTKINIDAYPEDWGQDEGEKTYESETLYGVVLPVEIGRVASDFDTWQTWAGDFDSGRQGYGVDHEYGKELLIAFTPYIEESIKETYKNGLFNDKGELIL